MPGENGQRPHESVVQSDTRAIRPLGRKNCRKTLHCPQHRFTKTLQINVLYYWHDLCLVIAGTIHLGKSHEKVSYRLGTCRRISIRLCGASEHLVLWNLDAMEQCWLYLWRWHDIPELQPDQLGGERRRRHAVLWRSRILRSAGGY